MKILDCTLRDGGYYTNWDFQDDLVEVYLKSVELLPIDIIEVGYRSVKKEGYLGQYFYCPLSTLKKIRKLAPSKEIAIMFNEKDILPEDGRALLKNTKEYIDIVRIAVNPKRIPEAIKLAEGIKKEGFQVAFNLMYMSKVLKEPKILESLSQLNGVIDYFNLVDSYGGIYPSDVTDTVNKIKPKLDMSIGFHGHNNLELAFINSMTALENGCDIVDSTITGMGRGAGNLKTELLLTWMNSEKNIDVNFNALSDVVSEFEKLQERCGWGTKLPYMVSGASSLPQQDVMDWVSKRHYSMNSIIRALHAQQNESNNDIELPPLEKKSYTKALIIGGGPSIIQFTDIIKEWIELNQQGLVVIHASARYAHLFADISPAQFYCLVGNEGHRLENVFSDVKNIKGKCILPPTPRKMGSYIPQIMKDKSFQLDKISVTDQFKDTHTAIALESACSFGASEICTAGYDGYGGVKIDDIEKDILHENDYIFQMFSAKHGKIKALTNTMYNHLEQNSIFPLLD